MKTSPVALVLATLALAACGSNPAKTADAGQGKQLEAAAPVAGAPDNATKDRKVEVAKSKRANCEKFTPIGSNRPQYRCLTPAEKAAESDANEQEMRKNTTPPSSSGIGN